jgi:hypothetical protein
MKVVTLIHKGKVQTISIEDLKKIKVELTQAWEGICRKCGKCCFDKSINPNGVVYINYAKPCEHLKFLGKRAECKVYSDRFVKCEVCQTIPEAIHKKYLPADCPYVKSVPAYKAPVDNGEWYKRARMKMAKINSEQYSGGDQPTGGTRNMPAAPPPRVTALESQSPSREHMPEWKRRKIERARAKRGGPVGILDPREKTNYNIKPSGHAGGG